MLNRNPAAPGEMSLCYPRTSPVTQRCMECILLLKKEERALQRKKEDARRMANRLEMLGAATSLIDLRMLPSNRLEALKDDRAGQFSIRINQQWRICFIWTQGGLDRVEIVDYH